MTTPPILQVNPTNSHHSRLRNAKLVSNSFWLFPYRAAHILSPLQNSRAALQKPVFDC